MHLSEMPIRQLSDSLSVEIIQKTSCIPCFAELNAAIDNLDTYQHLCLSDFLPSDAQPRYRFLQKIKCGLMKPVVLLTYSPGNNKGNLHFVWQFDDTSTSDIFEKSLSVVECVKPLLPQYHTRSMRKSLISKFGRVSSKVQSAVLRHFYRELTGDCTAGSNLTESEIDQRVSLVLDMEPDEPNTVFDLRSLNSSTSRAKFDVFWDQCSSYLNETVGTAVDDRRHSEVVHLAHAISVRDLRDEVKKRCPEGTLIPSLEWIRLQFWPKSKHMLAKTHYTGRLNIKFMIQKRQWRKEHCDSHYAAAIFRYMREMALMFKSYTAFVCLDDKHRVKVGEPGYPLAAAERGRRVLVRADTTFEVGDHDFAKFSIVPSVSLLVDIPTELSGSWYHGLVTVFLKEGAFEPSSPLRHTTELLHMLSSNGQLDKPILCVYTDGGPDHRVTYISVKLSLIALYLKLDLDYLLAARTAPCHSWRNPVERIMSTLNLGLQCVGLMRKEGSENFEKETSKCNSMKDLRRAADRCPEFKSEALDSTEPVKLLLTQVFQRLQLKDKNITCSPPATKENMTDLWNSLQQIESDCGDPSSLKTKSAVLEKKSLSEFMAHCCSEKHYFFEIRKCGSSTCNICQPPRLDCQIFEQLKQFPDPTPGDDGHYLPFATIYGRATSEEHRPSKKKKSSKQRTLPFHGKLQHVRNADLMLECEECGMWRLIYAKH